MLHYHGTPITPRSELYELAGKNFCVSFADPRDVEVVHRIGQSVMLDNGAYTVWKQGGQVDWQAWAEWVEPWLEYHNTWAVLPDSIQGDEHINDALCTEWAFMLSGKGRVVPVWHLHESLRRLVSLVDRYHHVCFGSSGQYATVGTAPWHDRVTKAFDTMHDSFGRVPWVHMLRGMSLSADIYPFASVDSTDIARNHHLPHQNARKMADRWDSMQCPPNWYAHRQLEIA